MDLGTAAPSKASSEGKVELRRLMWSESTKGRCNHFHTVGVPGHLCLFAMFLSFPIRLGHSVGGGNTVPARDEHQAKCTFL